MTVGFNHFYHEKFDLFISWPMAKNKNWSGSHLDVYLLINVLFEL